MFYPKSIYKNYQIIEKDISGEKHYGLVRIVSFFGIKFKRKVSVAPTSWYKGYVTERGNSFGRTWHSCRRVLEYAIRDDHQSQEYEFERKMTK